MRFQASHRTLYRYSERVFLEPHAIRLRPRSDSWQRLERYSIAVEPAPSLLTETVDAEGNDVAYAWFLDPTDFVSVKTEFEVETLRENPFDYVTLGEGATRLPLEYPHDTRESLSTALKVSDADRTAVREFMRPIADKGLDQPIPLLAALNEEIHRRFDVAVREHGRPLEPVPGRSRRSRSPAGTWRCSSWPAAGRPESPPASSAATRNRGSPPRGATCTHGWRSTFLAGGGGATTRRKA